jgi:hypothetical protein
MQHCNIFPNIAQVKPFFNYDLTITVAPYFSHQPVNCPRKPYMHEMGCLWEKYIYTNDKKRIIAAADNRTLIVEYPQCHRITVL